MSVPIESVTFHSSFILQGANVGICWLPNRHQSYEAWVNLYRGKAEDAQRCTHTSRDSDWAAFLAFGASWVWSPTTQGTFLCALSHIQYRSYQETELKKLSLWIEGSTNSLMNRIESALCRYGWIRRKLGNSQKSHTTGPDGEILQAQPGKSTMNYPSMWFKGTSFLTDTEKYELWRRLTRCRKFWQIVMTKDSLLT